MNGRASLSLVTSAALAATLAQSGLKPNNRAALTEALTPILQSRTTKDWIALLESADVPCGPINTLDQVYADPQVIARNAVVTVTRSNGDEIAIARSPIRMSETPPRDPIAPPLLGENTDGLLRELLGASDADLAAWRKVGAI